MLTAFGLFPKPAWIKEREKTISSQLDVAIKASEHTQRRTPTLKAGKMERELDWKDQNDAVIRSYRRRLRVIRFFWGE